jgi:NAD(P)-dependent dehydrogenase (short-subunit alcohol dehydrogenase family)
LSDIGSVLVAGGTSSMGEAVVRKLSRSGFRVAFSSRRPKQADQLSAETGAKFLQYFDKNPDGVEKLVSRANVVLGSLSGLVIAVGANHTARISETTDEAWDQLFQSNLILPFAYAKACFPLFSPGSSVVFIGSATAFWPEMELGAYSVSKKALLWLSQMLAMEGALKNIRVNCIAPGETSLSMSTYVEPQIRAIQTTPLPPIGVRPCAEDIAEAVEFFLSPDSSQCTGSSLTVDGGLRAALRANKVRHG